MGAATTASPLFARDFYLSPGGDDASDGGVESPLRTLQGVVKAVLSSEPGPGREPITVWIGGGRYPVTSTVTFGKELAGTRENPIRFRAVRGETPLFDAGMALRLAGSRVVEDASALERFAEEARGRVFSVTVGDQELRKALSSPSVRCSLDGRMMTLARYPNVGYGHLDRILDKGAVYANGRTPGDPPKWSLDNPIGGRFTILDKDLSAWEEEYRHAKKAVVTGYLAHDWYRQRHPIGSIEAGQVLLANSSRYGVINRSKVPRRLVVSNLLCELDSPGEFYFDEPASTLYFMPPTLVRDDSVLSVWSGPGLAHLRGASYVSFEGLVIEGAGKGKAAVLIEDCNNATLAGCTLRNSSRPAVRIEGGRRCGLRSCDLYDVPHHLTLNGGDVRKLEAAGNYAINCHFTQIAAADYYGRIGIGGVGNVFRNNLLHNFPGQVMVFGDCDHLIELNEFFNIGFEEGDGGTLYSGSSMWSWGNVIRNNFIHHLMCLPQAHPRGGIYPDDLDQGDTIEGNVFFKAAHRAVLLNGGAGHTVRDNLFLRGYIGVYSTQAGAEKAYKRIAEFERGTLKRGDKEDIIWRTEQVVGKQGWNNEPWASRYPLFRKIMNQEKMRFYPIECEIIGNRFAGNWRDIEYRTASGPDGVKPIGEVSHIRSTDNRKITMRVFRDPASLDFRYQEGRDASWLPEIPFEKIGLFDDNNYRPHAPEKPRYRTAVRKHFARQRSYDPKAVYDPRSVNETTYFNTGRLLAELGGFIQSSADQEGDSAGAGSRIADRERRL